MAFASPIDLSHQTKHTRYSLIRDRTTTRWLLGYEECLPQYKIDRPNGFPFWTLELVIRGNGMVHVHGQIFPLGTGSFFVYGPGTPIFFRSEGAHLAKYFLSALTVEAWQHSWFGRISPGRPLVVPGALTGPALLQQILSPGNITGFDRDAAAESMLEGFGAWLLTSGRSPEQPVEPDLLQRALHLLEVQYQSLQSVSAWAESLNISQSHLCRLFKKHHHKTPYAELTDRKLQHAYLRLSQTSLRVQDVAREVGYDDPFHFSRLFKRHMGFPPSQLR